ncbi:MAG: hypothetical protein AAF529_23750 [Pseudomonadota bacterium]
MSELLLLLGLTLGQALHPTALAPQMDASLTPLAYIEVDGQRHDISFPEVDDVQALHNVRAVLAMYGRDIQAYAVVEPNPLNNRRPGHLQRFSVVANSSLERSQVVAEVHLLEESGRLQVRAFNLSVNGGTPLREDALQEALQHVQSGYQQAEGDIGLPDLASGHAT